MTDSIFIDTNILVYAHDASDSDKHRIAGGLVADLWQSGDGVISTQVLQEFYVTVTQKVAAPVDQRLARRWVSNYMNWETVENDGAAILRAIDTQRRYQVSFWDAMILQAANAAGVKTLYSEDLNAGQRYGSVIVANPFSE